MRILTAVGSLVLLLLSIFLAETAFEKILDFRMLERIPLTSVLGSTEGEVQLKGSVTPVNLPLSSPKTASSSVYFRYLIEKKTTDSEGNTRWSTVHNEENAVDFYLEDATGRVIVQAKAALGTVKWGAPQKFRRTEGGYRYTEWRIDQAETVTIFGWYDFATTGPVVSFFKQGDYVPNVSARGASSVRGDLGWTAILLLAAGVCSLVFSVYLFVYTVQIHKVLSLLILVSVSSTTFLWYYGWQSMSNDVSAGYSRFQSQLQRSNALIKTALEEKGIDSNVDSVVDLAQPKFDALDEVEKRKINAWRISSYIVRQRYMQQISRHPEKIFARSLSLHNPTNIPLSKTQQTIAEQQLKDFEITRVKNKWWINLLCVALSIIGALWAFRFIKIKRMMENIPTSKTNGVSFGLTEVCGELKAQDNNATLAAPLTLAKSCWYQYIVEEKRGTGKNARWETVENKIEKQPFYCEDDEGTIRVFPSSAEVITSHIKRKREGQRRYTEKRLSPGDSLYILAKAVPDKTKGDSLVLRSDHDAPFIISNKPESEVLMAKALKGMGLLSVCVSAIFFSFLILLGQEGRFSSLEFVLASFAGPIFFSVIVVVIMFNDLVFLRQRSRRAWANIQVSLKKRANLFPQLESVAKAYLAHEQSLLVKISDLRNQLKDSDTLARSKNKVDGFMASEHALIDNIKIAIEAYPDLKADKVMKSLHIRVVSLENEISMIRKGFNDSVMLYNTRISQFPDNILARCFGFKDEEYLAFDQAAHQVPKL